MEKQKITIVIGTKSKDKIEGIKDAFLQYFPENEYDIEIYSSKTDSEVSEQPFGNETYQGAYNRINNVREQYEQKLNERGIDIDYYVSCEAGIDDTNKTIIRGVLTTLYASEQVVCIYSTKNDLYSFGKSSSWIIPSESVQEVKNTDLDKYLRSRGCTGLQDVGDGKYITRKDAIMEGTLSAIASDRFRDRCIRTQQKHDKEAQEI